MDNGQNNHVYYPRWQTRKPGKSTLCGGRPHGFWGGQPLFADNPFRKSFVLTRSPVQLENERVDSLGSSPIGSASLVNFQAKVLDTATGSSSKKQGHTSFAVGINNDQLPLWANQTRTQTEQWLFDAWQRELQEKTELKNSIAQLQEQNKQMLDKINQLLKEQERSNCNSSQTQQKIEYFTDEEELAKETEWMLVGKNKRNNKKRKANSSPESSPQQQDDQQQSAQKQQKKQIKAPPPPPIIVSQVKDFDMLHEALIRNELVINATAMNNDRVKLNASSEDEYRKITSFLNNNSYPWFSFENKQTRPTKVMARKLPPTFKTEKIIQDLKSRGYKILDAINILKRGDKSPLPLFMLTFQNEEDLQKIYDIKAIFGTKVTIEPLRKTKIVPQCKRCQDYGHTQNFCMKEPRCVKCAGKHLTPECKNPKNAPVKCANCKGDHPANYRGCEIAKRIQLMRNENTKNKLSRNNTNRITKEKSFVTPGKTFADTARSDKKEESLPDHEANQRPMTLEVEQLLSRLVEKLEQQDRTMKSIDERLNNLEKNSKKAAAKQKKK